MQAREGAPVARSHPQRVRLPQQRDVCARALCGRRRLRVHAAASVEAQATGAGFEPIAADATKLIGNTPMVGTIITMPIHPPSRPLCGCAQN